MPSQTARLHQLTVGSHFLNQAALSPIAFSWMSAINQTFLNQTLVFSYLFMDTDACSSLIGAPICLTTLSSTRTSMCRTGLIQAVRYQHSDAAIHFYALDIVTPDWQLTQSIQTRRFVQQSTLDILTSILGDYDFEWHVSEQLLSSERLTTSLAMRTQVEVSDWDFVISLLADIGASVLWVAGDSVDTLGYWHIVSGLDEDTRPAQYYRYAQSSIQSGQDTVNELQMGAAQLGSHTVIVRADGLAADTLYEGQAVDESPLAIEDTTVLLGAPSRIHSDQAATELAERWVQANRCQRETYQASGVMRGLSVGSQVHINDLPMIGSLLTHCLSMHIIGIEPDSDSVSYHHQTLIKTWLEQTVQYHKYPMTTETYTHSLPIPAHGHHIAKSTGIWVSATLLEHSIPYCPYPSRQSFVSHTYHGLTQARTGDTSSSPSPSYQSQVTDNLQQTLTTLVSSGISPHDDGTTPPLRSLQLSSGQSHGWQFAPRLGQSVLLTHWYGDIDSPVISRSIYDGIGMGDRDDKDITHRDAGLSNRHNLQGGVSPRWHGAGFGHSQISDDDSHKGWMSGIAQYGLTQASEVSLSFDDTPSKVGLQWTVNTGSKANAETPTITEQATFAPDTHVLELGVLRHRYSNHQSTTSGQGFRVASDNSLQVTASQGVLLSTFGVRHTQSDHESAWVNDAGQQQLKLGAELSETLKEAKQAHLQSTKALSNANQTIEAFKTSAQIIDESLNTEVLGAPDMMLVSKDSILASASNTLWTAKTIMRQSGSTQSDMVAGNYTLSADSIESLAGVGGQAEASGLHMSANREPLAIQAQGSELRLNSQLGMTVGSESGQVNVSSPKRIKLQTSAGASITIDDSGVKLVAPGEITVMAVRKALVSGSKVNAPVIALPVSGLFSRRFDFNQLLEAGILTAGRPYKIINHTKGTEFYDILPDDGKTPRIYGTEQDEIEVVIIGHEDAEELLMIENEIDNSSHDHEDEECCAPEDDEDTAESQPDLEINLNDNLEDDYHAFGN